MRPVSVVMAVFNGAATVARAIESVLGQDYDGIVDFIAVDDGSSDSTPAILARYDGRINVIRQKNRGAAAARNTGIALASGEIFAFIDADDVWMPSKLSKTVEALERDPKVVLAYSDALAVNDRDEVVANSIVPVEKARAPSMADLLSEWWPILPSTAILRREVIQACGGFCEDLRSYEDPYLFMLARELGEFCYVSEPLVRYHLAPAVERMEKYRPHCEIFIRRLRGRYGVAASSRIRATHRAYASVLGYRGLMAMRLGDLPEARRCFRRALSYEPLSMRASLRLARSYLPRVFARVLTGRTRNRSEWQNRPG
jgi:glycosyltransferase involved in cell wall biosynthesis